MASAQEVASPDLRRSEPGALEIRDLVVRFGGVVALDGPALSVGEREICGLIGPNGAGKTTLFNCISRLCEPDAGAIGFAGENLLRRRPHEIPVLGIARTFQSLALIRGLSVRENVLLGAHQQARAGLVGSALALGSVRREERRLRDAAEGILERLGLREIADRPAAGLPYGTLKRIELARAICQRPRLLLLDEPASGLTHGEVEELGKLIATLRDELGLTVLLVEHHVGLVMGVCERVVVLDFGRKLADGPPDEVRRDPAVIEAYLGADT